MKTTPSLLRLMLAISLFFSPFFSLGQNTPANQTALALVKKHAAAIGLSDALIAQSRISNTYDDATTGATLVYLQQTFLDIDVDKSIQVLAFKNGNLISASGARIDLSRSTINTSPVLQRQLSTPAVSAITAIQQAARHLQLPAPVINMAPAAGKNFVERVAFGDLGIAKETVTSRLLWIAQPTFAKLKLVWEVNISPKKTPDSWRLLVDAKDGKVVRKDNYNVPDYWGKRKENTPRNIVPAAGQATTARQAPKLPLNRDFDKAAYRVIPFPAEALSFPGGTPALVYDPWKLSPPGSGATPFDWNSDGVWQYKLSRGNNVLSQEDLNANNGHGLKAQATVQQDRLLFDFMPDFGAQPTNLVNQSFAITNLFYWNNIMHDLSYQYGFDERSGNFQQNNLGRGGEQLDLVFADAQDGSGRFNANFSTPPDGQHPRMQMFLFGTDPTKMMNINAPDSIAGPVLAVEGSVSPNNSLEQVGTVTADVVLYNDEDNAFHTACMPASNAGALKGKIALIDRGTCTFTSKILNAQQAGAIAVIMVNNLPGSPPITMAGDEPSIVIPAVMISYEDGTRIKLVLSEDIPVNVTLADAPLLDGDLDNGIICHEYGHGISNRLTGGPSNTTCLWNAEQMGEGWSDYFTLMTTTDWKTAQVSDGLRARGIGTYVLGEPIEGLGIRQYPYSVDFGINPHTYADVATSLQQVHNIGEVWATVLWDMTWALIVQDGINQDIFNADGKGGNSVAYKLVMTGMKLQPCSPGFIDGRNAILKADSLLYNGRHTCAIWQAFARRGMGVGASQGSSDIAGDEIVDFSEAAILLSKKADKQNAAPGEVITYTLNLQAKGVCGSQISQQYSAVTDSLPGNVTYINSDGVYDPEKRTVSFYNIDLAVGESRDYTIQVEVNDDAVFQDSVYLNDHANTPAVSKKWIAKGGDNLSWTKIYFGGNDYGYYSNDTGGRARTSLETATGYFIPGNTTTFSFFNWIISHDMLNGGVVEITTDGGDTWQDLGPYMSGFVYNQTITGNSMLEGRKAFTGFGYFGFYGTTVIDLSAFAGKTVNIRFLYATSDGSFALPDGGTGWIIDDIVLSATPSASNTARLLDKDGKLKGFSTVVTTIAGQNANRIFIAEKKNEAEALLSWNAPAGWKGSFKVERSVDNGRSFTEIGALQNREAKQGQATLHFTDASPAAGNNLYRIGFVDTRQSIRYTGAKELQFSKATEVRIAPNPAKERVQVFVPGNAQQITIQLTGGDGKLIQTYKASGPTAQLQLPVLAAGMYYLKITKEDGTISRHKLMVQ